MTATDRSIPGGAEMLGKKTLLIGSLGLAAFYFFNGEKGAARRAKVQHGIGKLIGRARSGRGKLEDQGPRSLQDGVPPADPVLESRIESEVLSKHRYPKGQVTIEVIGATVTLRGQLDSAEAISGLEQDVRKVDGVLEVRNFLHLPNQDPPNKEDAIRASRESK
jgi:osmotically-inducible protein OsmY